MTREFSDLGKDFERLQAEVSEVARHATVIDPATGEAKAEPVLRMSAGRRKAALAQMGDISRRMRLLMTDDGELGIESIKRRRQALYESVMARVELDNALTERAEAKAMAETINREARIRKQAESLARVQRNGG